MADNGYGAAVKFSQPGDDGFVVPIPAIAMQLDEICKQEPDEIERVRPLRMPRNLRALPGTEMLIKLPAQLRHLLTETLQIAFAVGTDGELPQFLDFLFKPVDFALAASLRGRFLPGGHYRTSSTAWSPQI